MDADPSFPNMLVVLISKCNPQFHKGKCFLSGWIMHSKQQ